MPLDRATYQRIFASGVKYGMSRRAPMDDTEREFKRLVLAGLVALVTSVADCMSDELAARALEWMREAREFNREHLQDEQDT